MGHKGDDSPKKNTSINNSNSANNNDSNKNRNKKVTNANVKFVLCTLDGFIDDCKTVNHANDEKVLVPKSFMKDSCKICTSKGQFNGSCLEHACPVKWQW